jgi:hypothetical protein
MVADSKKGKVKKLVCVLIQQQGQSNLRRMEKWAIARDDE